VVPGNSYPVIENINDSGNFLGKALTAGYNSHTVVTTREGKPITSVDEPEFFTELVIDQEALALPAFIISINRQYLYKKIQATLANQNQSTTVELAASDSGTMQELNPLPRTKVFSMPPLPEEKRHRRTETGGERETRNSIPLVSFFNDQEELV